MLSIARAGLRHVGGSDRASLRAACELQETGWAQDFPGRGRVPWGGAVSLGVGRGGRLRLLQSCTDRGWGGTRRGGQRQSRGRILGCDVAEGKSCGVPRPRRVVPRSGCWDGFVCSHNGWVRDDMFAPGGSGLHLTSPGVLIETHLPTRVAVYT